MPLNWSVANIEDWRTVCCEIREDGESYWRSNTERLIFALMGIGINRITEKNYEKVAERLYMDRVIGTTNFSSTVNLYAVVKAHIGMHTNVAPITDAKYKGIVYGEVKSRAQRLMKQEQEQLASEEGGNNDE